MRSRKNSSVDALVQQRQLLADHTQFRVETASTLLYAKATTTAQLRSHSCFPDRLVILNEDRVLSSVQLVLLRSFPSNCRAKKPQNQCLGSLVMKKNLGLPLVPLKSRTYATLFPLSRVRFWVRSIGKSGFRFSKSKSGFPNRTRNPKTDFLSEKSVLRVDFN